VLFSFHLIAAAYPRGGYRADASNIGFLFLHHEDILAQVFYL